MKLFNLIQIALKALQRNKLRAFFNHAGYHHWRGGGNSNGSHRAGVKAKYTGPAKQHGFEYDNHTPKQ